MGTDWEGMDISSDNTSQGRLKRVYHKGGETWDYCLQVIFFILHNRLQQGQAKYEDFCYTVLFNLRGLMTDFCDTRSICICSIICTNVDAACPALLPYTNMRAVSRKFKPSIKNVVEQ